MSKQKKTSLTPPDLTRCQAEKADGSFMTLGPVSRTRCSNAPVVVAKERKPAADGLRGSMSLCAECQKALVEQMGKHYASFRKLPKISSRKFYRNVFWVEILSEEPLPDLPLKTLMAECEDGPYSGDSGRTDAPEVIDGARAAKLLLQQGSDPSFFGLTAKGEDVEE
jgi:hypothetical protein